MFFLDPHKEEQYKKAQEYLSNFNIEKYIDMFLSGELKSQIENISYYSPEHKRILEKIKKLDANDPFLHFNLYFALQPYGLILMNTFAKEDRLKAKKSLIKRNKGANESIINNAYRTALNQLDLISLLEDNESTIYLYGKEFTIPYNLSNKKFIGILSTPKLIVPYHQAEELYDRNIEITNIALTFPKTHNIPPNDRDAYKKLKDYFYTYGAHKYPWTEKNKSGIISCIHVFVPSFNKKGRLTTEIKCTDSLSAAQKELILDIICQGRYAEEDIIYLLISNDFSYGWAVTYDSLCYGGVCGTGCIYFKDIKFEKSTSGIRTIFFKDITHAPFWKGALDTSNIASSIQLAFIKFREMPRFIKSAKEKGIL